MARDEHCLGNTKKPLVCFYFFFHNNLPIHKQCYGFTNKNVFLRYNEERDDPDIPRNMPPVAGRVLWIRFYHKNIIRPMKVYENHHEVITHMVISTLL